MGQGQQERPGVKIRQRVAVREEHHAPARIEIGDGGGQQGVERRLADDDETADALGRPADQPDELDGVAEALLPVDENGLGEVRFARPHGLAGECAREGGVGKVEATLHSRPVGPVAQQQSGKAHVVVPLGKRRPVRRPGLPKGDRLLHPAGVAQEDAEVEACTAVSGLLAEQARVDVRGFRVAALFGQNDPEVVERFRMVGRQRSARRRRLSASP